MASRNDEDPGQRSSGSFCFRVQLAVHNREQFVGCLPVSLIGAADERLELLLHGFSFIGWLFPF